MTDQPLVSVVLPTFNRANLLPRALDSVLSQTYKPLEVIVVDDASTDRTADTLAAYTQRIRYVRLEQNTGAAAARNRGIELASGEYVAFQDSDDVWRPNKIDWHITAMTTDAAIGVSVCAFDVHKDGRTYRIRHDDTRVDGEECTRRLLMGAAMPTQTLVVRKDALQSIGGFDETLPRRQDFDLCLRLARSCSFRLGRECLVDNYVSADSISTDPSKYVAATARLLETHRDLFERYPAGLSFQMYNVAKHLAFTGHRDAAIPYVRRALEADRSNLRARALWFGLHTRTLSLLKALKG